MFAKECLFCKIIAGDIPADIVYSDDQVLVFRDINPQAPIHILLIPQKHVDSLASITDEHCGIIGKMMITARKVAATEGLSESGYRAVINVGSDGGQTVNHLHMHLLGGRTFRWPPG